MAAHDAVESMPIFRGIRTNAPIAPPPPPKRRGGPPKNGAANL